VRKTYSGALGVFLSVVVAACGGDDSGSSGTAGTNLGNTGGSLGGAGGIGLGGSAGSIGLGGAAGTAGSTGTAGSAGNAGGQGGSGGGVVMPEAGAGNAGSNGDASADATSGDVSVGSDGSNSDVANTDSASSAETGTDAGSSSDANSEAVGPADSGVDVGIALSCDAGEGLQIKSVPGLGGGGWVDRSTNCVGIQGAVFVYFDTGGSNAYLTSTTNHICVAGLAKHDAALGSTHWGAVVAIQLNNNGVGETLYDATAHGVTGFDFTLSGASVPSGLVAEYLVDGQATPYCEVINGAGAKTSLISNSHPGCYLADAGASVPPADSLVRLEFKILANTTTDVNFDFCIDNLTAKKQ